MIALNPISKTPKTEYQMARDGLIPEAERLADEKVKKGNNIQKYRVRWTKMFFQEMNRLAIEKDIWGRKKRKIKLSNVTTA